MKLPSAQTNDRERFLAAVAEHVPVDRVVELYLFQPIRQGGVESGVAVIAAAGDAPVAGAAPLRSDVPEQLPADLASPADDSEPRYTVFTARYRHVLKGPDRGHWEVSVVAEADAPLATVGAVVRGVQRRAGDMEPPEHMTGGALRDVLGQAPGASG
jgi:hypothetical protein